LRSVYNQTVAASEILIIDDASEPPLELPAELLDPRTRIIRNPKALGGAAARNVGLAAASGDCVGFLDDDDEWTPDKMELQLDYLDKHPDCVWVSCGYTRLQDGAEYPEIFSESFVRKYGEYDTFVGSFSFAVITRRADGSFPLLDPSLRAFQDWGYFLSQRWQGAVGIVEKALVLYHAHQSPRITNGRRNRMSGLRRCYFRHRTDFQPDARRWLVSRLVFERAQMEQSWSRKRRLTIQSMLAGAGCQLPFKVKGRALGKRLLSLGFNISALETFRSKVLAVIYRLRHRGNGRECPVIG
jgi:glycosyltransferase involved in cell wall biosynthesis